MADLITQADVEARMTARHLRDCTDDDADGVADPGVVSAILDEASRIAEGLLWDGFPSLVQIADLVANDTAIKGAISDIACGLAGQRKHEWVGTDGKPAQWWRRERGEKILRQIATSQGRRAAGEAVAGIGSLNHNRVGRDRPPVFTFANTQADPKGPGGF